MTILKFPEDKALENLLDERRADLDELYDSLARAFELVDKMEEKAAALEAEYNIHLRRYAHAKGGVENVEVGYLEYSSCLLYTSPSPRDGLLSRMPSSA